MSDNLFSIIIPTMWKSKHLVKMLDLYQKSKYVYEIILIDNDPKNKLELPNYDKILYYSENKNIYFNPACNICYNLYSKKLILANDDILINNLDDVLNLINNSDYDVIGVNVKKENKLSIDVVKTFPGNGYGCFLYIKNYKYIPTKYKIWRGDYIQFINGKKNGILNNPHIGGDISTTIDNDPELIKIAKKDSETYKITNKFENPIKKNVLFVLVNYGYEQIKFLEKVVSEIKNFKNYNVKIIVNSNVGLNIPGIDKVNIFNNLSDYQLLPLTCRKTIIEYKNQYDLFVYGENDHLFKEFHLDNHLEYSSILPNNRISGLIQYEESENGLKHYPAYHKEYEWDFSSVEEYSGLKFAHFTNHHQASFILTKEQLNFISEKHDFSNFFGDSNYSLKCKVNTDIYQLSGLKKMICISEFKDNLIHHLPNLYINGDLGRNKSQSSDNQRMKSSLITLFTNKSEANKKLSIIIPTFNNVEFIKECLSSVIKSVKSLNCEILVGIDDCKKTLNFVEKEIFDSRIRFFYFSQNVGPYIVKNTLVKNSNSETILFFDSDDVMCENMVEEILRMQSFNDFVRPKYNNFNGVTPTNNPVNKEKLFGEGVFSIKKSLFLSMNGFEGWRTTADTDFIGRLYKNSRKSINTPTVLFYRRLHQNSLTQSKQTGHGSKIRSDYNNLIRNKKTFGPLPYLCISPFYEVSVGHIKPIEVFDEVKHKKMVINEVVKKILSNTNLSKTNIDYDSINKITQQKGVYVPVNHIKPIRENKPVDRTKITELRKDSLLYQSQKFGDVKKSKKSSSPNIFSGNNRRKGGLSL